MADRCDDCEAHRYMVRADGDLKAQVESLDSCLRIVKNQYGQIDIRMKIIEDMLKEYNPAILATRIQYIRDRSKREFSIALLVLSALLALAITAFKVQ